MYSWTQFRNLPAIKDLDQSAQAQKYYQYQSANENNLINIPAASSLAAGGHSAIPPCPPCPPCPEPNGAIPVTKAEADTLIGSNSLITGASYEISGVNPTLYGGTTIILQAVSTNAFSESGSGQFFNPKYDQSVSGYGIWSNISKWSATLTSGTFLPNEALTADNGATATLFTNLYANEFIVTSGDWTTASSITGNSSGATANISIVSLISYGIGAIVFWGGKAWTNTTGNVGISTDVLNLDTTDWTVISYSDTTQYNTVWDEIKYDYANDLIIYRKDVANNIVSTSKGNEQYNSDNYTPFSCIAVFQWGNPYDYFIGLGVGENIIDGSYCENVNFSGNTFIYNNLTSNSSFNNNTLSNGSFNNNTLSSSSYFNSNTLSSNSSFYNNTLSNSSFDNNTLSSNSSFNNNTLSNGSYFYNNTLSSSSFNNNTLSNGSFNNNTLSNGSFNNNTLSSSSFDNNTLSNSYFDNNTLSSSSYFNNNTLSNGSFDNNTLSSSSYFYNNELNSGSYFYNNELNSGSSIQNSILKDVTSNNIQYNILSGFSTIDSANMQNGSGIQNNTLTEESSYSNVTISGGVVFKWNKIQLNFTYNTSPQTTDITKQVFQ